MTETEQGSTKKIRIPNRFVTQTVFKPNDIFCPFCEHFERGNYFNLFHKRASVFRTVLEQFVGIEN